MSSNRLLKFSFFWIICIFFHLSCLAAAGPPPSDLMQQGTLQQTFTLLQINGMNGLTFKGTNATNVLYLPLPPQWDLQNVHLHFLFSRAFKLGPANNLNLLMNDMPISSFQLKTAPEEQSAWDIDVPRQLIKGNIINLKILSNTPEQVNNCLAILDPNYWINLSGDSTITYQYSLKKFVPDLRQFPFPFINKQGLQKDSVTLTTGAMDHVDQLQAIFYVANALGQYETWRGLALNFSNIDTLSDVQKSNTNIILIGTAKNLKLDQLPIQLPLPLDRDNGLLHKDHTPLSSDEGVLILSQSPWAPTKGLLIVSGNTDDAVKNAALKLRDPNFVSTLLYSEYAFVHEAPLFINRATYFNPVTFSNLGWDTQTIYGVGENSLNYTIDLTRDQSIASIDLNVLYNASTLLNKKSYVSLNVNDTPISGKKLFWKNNATWRIKINKDNLKNGLNTFKFIFSLHLPQENCMPVESNLAWASILKNTQIKINYQNKRPLLYLTQINSLFKNNLLITLPSQWENNTAMLNSLLNIVKRFNQVNYIVLTPNDHLNEQDLTTQDIMAIGNPSPTVMQLPIYYEENQLRIEPKLLKRVSTSDEVPIGIISLVPSPFSKNKLILSIVADHDKNYQTVLDNITNVNKLSLTNGNVLLVYANGTFISIQSQKLLTPTLQQTINKGLSPIWLIIGLLSLLAIIAIVLGLFWWAIKKIKGRQVDGK